jgi:hypothetical protein
MSDSDSPPSPVPQFRSTADSNAGFGFGQPSDVWLKAHGYKKTHFKGAVGRLGDEMEIEEPVEQVEDSKERDRIRREKFLNRLGQDYEIPTPVQREQVTSKDTEKERRRRELAQKREKAMKLAQNVTSEIRSLEMAAHSPVKKREETEEERLKREKLTKWIQQEPLAQPVTKARKEKQIDVARLWNSGTGDFTVFLADGSSVNLHRSLLMARSSVFNSMLSSQLSEGSSSSLELDQSPEALKAMFEFMYTGKLACPSNLITSVLELSNYYGMPGLKQLLEISLFKLIDKDNLSDLFDLSISTDARILYEGCISYYSAHFKECRSIQSSLPAELISVYRSRV